MDTGTKARSIGRLLIDRGMATEEQIAYCVDLQRKRARSGDFSRIGTILVEQRVVTAAQVAEVLKEQKITILICAICKSQYNIHNFSKNGYYECRKCHGPLKKPSSLDSLIIQDSMRTRQKPPSSGRKPSAKDTIVAPIRKRSKTPNEGLQSQRIGNYEILGEIARGGMGVIYKARQLALNRDVALKTLNAEEARREDAVERFQREAQAIASLRHPNLVAVHTVDRYQDIHFFTMEFVEGIPLDALLKKEGPMTGERAVEVLLPIVDSLEYSHREGVVHRDLKPANIIIDMHDTPFLVDFGIAKRKGDRQLTQTGEILGSVPYMAPEYIMGEEYTEACDVYSIGVCLYESLAGFENLPFGSDNTDIETIRLLKKIAYEAPAPIRNFRPDIDPVLEAIIMKAITRDLSVRYSDAATLAADFRAWLEQRRKAMVIVERAPSWVWGLIVLAILGLAGTVGLLIYNAEKQRGLQAEVQTLVEEQVKEIERLEAAGKLDEAAKQKTALKKFCKGKGWLSELKSRIEGQAASDEKAADKPDKDEPGKKAPDKKEPVKL
ncbi:MAG: serine/threonine-protein kinase, partial [Planctomycetota bacterium]|nr:serine/threonine-protein kinase [Planctomycetota bacterium]